MATKTTKEAAPQVETEAAREREEKKVERVAVLFVHGQGEQIPMQDPAELAEAVWARAPETEGQIRQVWSVPVFDSQMSEQRRLVTARVTREGKRDLQVDFYQFYWADLMTGNHFVHLWKWFTGLFARGAETPKALVVIRRQAMLAAGAVAWAGAIFGLITAARLAIWDLFSWGALYAILLAVTALGVILKVMFNSARRKDAMIGGAALIVISLVMGVFALPILDGRCEVVELISKTGPPFAPDGCEDVVKPRWLEPFNVAPGLLPDLPAYGHAGFTGLLIALAAVLGFKAWQAYNSFLVPVMADSARMFTNTPENIPNRDRVRKRGMELLEALHGSERRYDRIVVLAHSLGTAVAYQVLSQYWGNVYRLFNQDACEAERTEMAQAGKALGAGIDRPSALKRFRTAVRAHYRKMTSYEARKPSEDIEWRTSEFTSVGSLLRDVLRGLENLKDPKPVNPNLERAVYRAPWRVTDFITIGSPLTYARFLMSESDAGFEEMTRSRRFPVCPPEGDNGHFHHASLFGVTAWTNIYFETPRPTSGDIVGGPVAGVSPHGLGLGILDVQVPMEKGMPTFAHGEYWRWPAGLEGDPPAYLLALRMALNLFDADGRDEALIDAAAAGLSPTRKR